MARTIKDRKRRSERRVGTLIRNVEVVDGDHLTYTIRGEAWTVIAKRDAKRAAARARRRASRDLLDNQEAPY